MKYLFFSFVLLAGLQLQSQEAEAIKADNRFYISAGSHLNFWAHVGLRRIPFDVHAETLFAERHALGLGYSYEEYKEFPYLFWWEPRFGDNRHNIRVRYLFYFESYQRFFKHYIGTSIGVSCWTSLNPNNRNHFLPTSQFLYGMKFQFSDWVFLNLEFAAGAPYMLRAALGTSF